MRALRYSFEEAVASLWRGRRSSSLSVASIAAALVVLGALLLLSRNVERLLVRWAAAAEMSVYVHDGVTPEARAAVEQTLRESALVSEYEFVSKTEALSRFRRDFSDLAGVTEQVTANPFPASFEVRLAPDVRDTAGVERLASVLQGATGVEEVRFDQTWIERLTSAVALLRGVGLLVVLVLVVAAALTVAQRRPAYLFLPAGRDRDHAVGRRTALLRAGALRARGCVAGRHRCARGAGDTGYRLRGRRVMVRRGGCPCA